MSYLNSSRLIREPLLSKKLSNKLRRKRGFRHDPLVILAYFVLAGVLISSLTSFGL